MPRKKAEPAPKVSETKTTFKYKELSPEQMFPYETFPIRLEYQDRKEHRVCHFQCEEHLQKHLERYKLDKRTIRIDYRDKKPPKPRQKRKRSVEQKSPTKSKGSTSTGKGRTPCVDSTRNTSSTSKSKRKK